MRDLTVHLDKPNRLYGFYLAEDVHNVRPLVKLCNTISAPEMCFSFKKRSSWRLRPRMATKDMVTHLLIKLNTILPKEEYSGAFIVMFSEQGFIVMGSDVHTYLVSGDFKNVTPITDINLTYH